MISRIRFLLGGSATVVTLAAVVIPICADVACRLALTGGRGGNTQQAN